MNYRHYVLQFQNLLYRRGLENKDIEDLLDKFSESVDNIISDLLINGLEDCINYSRSNGYYFFEGKIILQDFKIVLIKDIYNIKYTKENKKEQIVVGNSQKKSNLNNLTDKIKNMKETPSSLKEGSRISPSDYKSNILQKEVSIEQQKTRNEKPDTYISITLEELLEAERDIEFYINNVNLYIQKEMDYQIKDLFEEIIRGF